MIRRMRIGLIAVGLVAAAWSLSGCGGNDRCESDGDCENNQICTQGTCAEDWRVGPETGTDADDATDSNPDRTPEIALTSSDLALRAPGVGTEVHQVFQIRNRGTATLEAGPFRLFGDDAFEVTFPTGEPGPADRDQDQVGTVVIPPGDGRYVRVRYRPVDRGDAQGRLEIGSNDPAAPKVVVSLQGRVGGIDGPCVEVDSSDTLDFGRVDWGSSAEETVTVRNCSSNEPLRIDSAQVSPSPPFTVDLRTGGGVQIAPGESYELGVTFAPPEAKKYTGQLTINTDVPSNGQTIVALLGYGRGGDCPRAKAEAAVVGSGGGSSDRTIVTQTQNTLQFDGAGSVAEEGSIARYEWRVTDKPDGSTAHFEPNASSGKPKMTLDLVGSYEVALDVYDDDDTKSCQPATISIEAKPPSKDIYVEMYWDDQQDQNPHDGTGSDMDLHYLNDSEASAWNKAPWDIHWDNPTADWGQEGYSGDDPEMIVDDDAGFGPEVIVHDEPGSGQSYTVGVYYYDDGGFGSAKATVRIWIQGQKKVDLTSGKMKPFWFWKVGVVKWPTGNFAPRDNIYQRGFPAP